MEEHKNAQLDEILSLAQQEQEDFNSFLELMKNHCQDMGRSVPDVDVLRDVFGLIKMIDLKNKIEELNTDVYRINKRLDLVDAKLFMAENNLKTLNNLCRV